MTRVSVVGGLFSFCASMCIAIGSAAYAQGATAVDVPRLDQKSIAHGLVFNEGGMAILGRTCHILRVEAGQVFGVLASVPKHQPALELVDGARCIFDRSTDHLPKLTAAPKDKSGVTYLRVDRPGFYSVRVTVEGADRGTPAMVSATRLEK